MVQFTGDLLSICKAYNLEPNQIVMAFAVAAGCPSSDAYLITHKCKTTVTQDQAAAQYNALIASHPGLKIIINKIKNRQNPATFKRQQQEELERLQAESTELSEEEKNEFCTRSGLIEKLINSVKLTTGKDRVSGLQTLAKLQGFDKPDETNEEEKRTFFLPWVSHCRTCKLMEVYKRALQEMADEKPPI